ncbi:MAG TPA: hypothetical protein VKX96_08025 [Chloroflexota bacterium]|nr:hypothetical protein [Chloroflexota bacterium]
MEAASDWDRWLAPIRAYIKQQLAEQAWPSLAVALAQEGQIGWEIDGSLRAIKLTTRVRDAREATVRRVANHTAGLPLHYHFFPVDEPVQPPSRAETARRTARRSAHRPLAAGHALRKRLASLGIAGYSE